MATLVQEVNVRLIIEYEGVQEEELNRNDIDWATIGSHAEQWVGEHLVEAGIRPDQIVAAFNAGSAREFVRDDDTYGQQRRKARVSISVPVPEAWRK